MSISPHQTRRLKVDCVASRWLSGASLEWNAAVFV
jgi:hypothetical protein